MLSQEHFIGYVTTTSNNTFTNNFETNGAPYKNPKMCDPILVTLLKMQPHYSQSSRENATPSLARLASVAQIEEHARRLIRK